MSVYNGEKFLRAAIDSVLKQTLQDWELIVIDDASTDSTLSILASYRDARIRIFRCLIVYWSRSVTWTGIPR
jgi:glycosyltransferase involved in cell wall biosynthesis